MEIGGPLGGIKYLQKIPSPFVYEPKPKRDVRAPSFNSRLSDHYL
jgi:hypothetical protein